MCICKSCSYFHLISLSLCLSLSTNLLNKCVLMQKVVHGKAPQYLKDLMIPSERLHVHGNKQLLPRTRIDIFKTSFSFSGSLAWNSLAHHLRYPMELKTFKRKAFQALAKPPWILRYTSSSFFFLLLFLLARQTAWHEMYRMLLLFSLPCSCKVLDLCVCVCVCVCGIFMKYLPLFSSWSFFFSPSNLMFAYMIVGVCDVLWFWLGVYIL